MQTVREGSTFESSAIQHKAALDSLSLLAALCANQDSALAVIEEGGARLFLEVFSLSSKAINCSIL